MPRRNGAIYNGPDSVPYHANNIRERRKSSRSSPEWLIGRAVTQESLAELSEVIDSPVLASLSIPSQLREGTPTLHYRLLKRDEPGGNGDKAVLQGVYRSRATALGSLTVATRHLFPVSIKEKHYLGLSIGDNPISEDENKGHVIQDEREVIDDVLGKYFEMSEYRRGVPTHTINVLQFASGDTDSLIKVCVDLSAGLPSHVTLDLVDVLPLDAPAKAETHL
jgi:hypothetical protein